MEYSWVSERRKANSCANNSSPWWSRSSSRSHWYYGKRKAPCCWIKLVYQKKFWRRVYFENLSRRWPSLRVHRCNEASNKGYYPKIYYRLPIQSLNSHRHNSLSDSILATEKFLSSFQVAWIVSSYQHRPRYEQLRRCFYQYRNGRRKVFGEKPNKIEWSRKTSWSQKRIHEFQWYRSSTMP